MTIQNNCLVCGAALQKTNAKYCRNGKCRAAARNQQVSMYCKPAVANISQGKVGAYGELIVCADLILRGYEVFRSVSQDCSCDLIILKSGQYRRIEVTAGRRTKTGKIYGAPHDSDKYDIVALVYDRKVYYSLGTATNDGDNADIEDLFALARPSIQEGK